MELGLQQGSALGSFLLLLVMDRQTAEVREEPVWTRMFADDVVMCRESREKVEVYSGEERNEGRLQQNREHLSVNVRD